MKPLLIIGSLIALLIIGKVFFWSDEEAVPARVQSKEKGALPVEIIPVSLNESDMVVSSSGTLAPNEEVELKPEVSGLLVQLKLQEGTYVKKGQLIAKIKDDDILAQLKKIEVEEDLAQQIEARQKKLLAIEAISKEEYDISMNNVKTLSADKELLQVQLAKTELRAPFAGRIGLKNISEGAYITPTSVITTLVQTNPLKVDFTIPEKYLNQVKLGQQVTFMIDGSKEVYSSKIVAIDPKINEELRTLKVRAITNNPGGRLLPGMFVNVNLLLNREESVTIPSESIIPVLAGKKVLLKKNGVVVEAMIETGLRDEKNVQVLSGLQPGDSLINSALMTLKPGMKVTAIK
ncbi:efflux RND transporter periplasmic adaptor subunit [Marinilongibacter aquaticus]|uniref:efflux RND transporter periplasmic adaptor subunit n=1 Tax=Marinilongibacter aquaticus TaxID=2975157 RepID=UPI0021BDC047|nr:efflux RND transporter periplasmic adaptor subunit [Marinilongibacter aquaticus]UBM58486.1 efflux RND transporter periplasmic adaptor subunit [Marinilongibacter aquaticus]